MNTRLSPMPWHTHDQPIRTNSEAKNLPKSYISFTEFRDFNSNPETIMKGNKIGRQALDTIYDLVWEGKFKNILNVGRVWLKFKEEDNI
jgi:hypothetical protein